MKSSHAISTLDVPTLDVPHRVGAVLIAFVLVEGGSPFARAAEPAPPMLPSPESTEAEAQIHFERGVSLYRDADFQSALFEFKTAYELAPNYRLFYNIAVAYMELHDYAAAQTNFRAYLDGGGAMIDASRRTAIEGELAQLSDRVGQIILRSEPTGATVRLDGKVVGETPLELTANLGPREIEVSHEGFRTETTAVSLTGGARIPREFVLTPMTATDLRAPSAAQWAEVSRVDETSKTAPPNKLAVATWTTLGIAVASGVGAITTGVLSLQAEDDLHAQLDTFTTEGELSDVESRAQALAIATDVLVGVTVATGIAAVTLGIIWSRRRHPSRSDRGRTASRLQPSAGGLALRF